MGTRVTDIIPRSMVRHFLKIFLLLALVYLLLHAIGFYRLLANDTEGIVQPPFKGAGA
jgi:hypothetical protein